MGGVQYPVNQSMRLTHPQISDGCYFAYTVKYNYQSRPEDQGCLDPSFGHFSFHTINSSTHQRNKPPNHQQNTPPQDVQGGVHMSKRFRSNVSLSAVPFSTFPTHYG